LTLGAAAATTLPVTALEWSFGNGKSKPPVLRGTTQVLAVNFNSQAITSGSMNISIEWTEDSF
jgi:hypothetical protein